MHYLFSLHVLLVNSSLYTCCLLADTQSAVRHDFIWLKGYVTSFENIMHISTRHSYILTIKRLCILKHNNYFISDENSKENYSMYDF